MEVAEYLDAQRVGHASGFDRIEAGGRDEPFGHGCGDVVVRCVEEDGALRRAPEASCPAGRVPNALAKWVPVGRREVTTSPADRPSGRVRETLPLSTLIGFEGWRGQCRHRRQGHRSLLSPHNPR
jgi:hypothetical protein